MSEKVIYDLFAFIMDFLFLFCFVIFNVEEIMNFIFFFLNNILEWLRMIVVLGFYFHAKMVVQLGEENFYL